MKVPFGTTSNELLRVGVGGIPVLALSFHGGKKHNFFRPYGGFLTHTWIITGNKWITDKPYNEAKMRTPETTCRDT